MDENNLTKPISAWRDPLRILGVAIAILILLKIVVRTYFDQNLGTYLDVPIYGGLALAIVLGVMRKSGNI